MFSGILKMGHVTGWSLLELLSWHPPIVVNSYILVVV